MSRPPSRSSRRLADAAREPRRPAVAARLPASVRARIEAKLTDDGVLGSLYVPPEQWRETQSAAALRWEQRVQLEAQRSGNQLRQNEILGNELGKM